MLKKFFVSMGAASLLTPTAAFAHMFGYGYSGWGVGMGMFLFWVILIFIFISLVRWAGWRGHYSQHHQDRGTTPLDILKERYAKGEITREQFEQIKKDLQ